MGSLGDAILVVRIIDAERTLLEEVALVGEDGCLGVAAYKVGEDAPAWHDDNLMKGILGGAEAQNDIAHGVALQVDFG